MYINELSFDAFIEIELLFEDMERDIRFKTKVDSIEDYVLKAVVPNNLLGAKDIVKVALYYKTEDICRRWICDPLGFEKSNSLNLIVIGCNQKGEHYNERSAFRIPYDKDMIYECSEDRCTGRYRDLSAEGIGFYSNQEHVVKEKLSFFIDDEDIRVQVEGEIVRRIEQKKGDFKYLYGVKIEGEYETIMGFIFKKQVEIIRKKRLQAYSY